MLFLATALFFIPHYEMTLPGDVGDPAFDSARNLYFTSADPKTGSRAITRLDPDGNVVYRVSPAPPGTLASSIRPFIPDAAGNIYAVTVAAKAGTNSQECLLTKIDPAGSLIYAFPLPGSVCYPSTTGQESIAVGADGSVFLAGSELVGVPHNGPPLSTTPGAYVPSSAAATSQLNAYVIKVNPQGTAIVYSTWLDPAPLTPLKYSPSTKEWALAVDSRGNAYVTGTTDDPGFPTTAGAFMAACNCDNGKPAIFVAKLNADGANVSYSTFIKPQPFAYGSSLDTNPLPPMLSIAVDSAMQATVMQAQRTYGLGPFSSDTLLGISLTTIAPAGSAVSNYSTTAFPARDSVRAASDGQGNVLVTGNYAAGNMAVSPGAFTNGAGFAALLRVTDGAILYATRLPAGATGDIVPDGSGGFLLAGALTGFNPHQGTQISRLVPAAAGPPIVLGVSNAGGLRVSSGLAPGEIVAIYGVGLGPGDGAAGQFDAAGNLPRQLGGTAVYFNDVPAPLLYSGNQQVNAIVPFSIRDGAAAKVRVVANGVETAVSLPEHDADPEIFRSYEAGGLPFLHSFAVNQDGSLNTAKNPAKLGTTVGVFVSGAGLLTPTPQDGRPGVSGEQVALSVTAVGRYLASDGSCCQRFNMSRPATASAPGLPAGVVRVDLQLPSSLPATGPGEKPRTELGVTLGFGPAGGDASYSTDGAIWISTGN